MTRLPAVTLTRKLVLPASALAAAAVGMTLLSQPACTVESDDEPCNECLFQQCTGEWAVCQQNADCTALYTCTILAQPCTDTSAVGARELAVLTACNAAAACGACASLCSATCADGGAMDTAVPLADAPAANDAAPVDSAQDDGGDEDATTPFDAASPVDAAAPVDAASPATLDVPACTSCVATTCTAQKSACGGGQQCDAYAQCAAGCSNGACVSTCGTTYPQGTMDEESLATCVLGGCSPQCGY